MNDLVLWFILIFLLVAGAGATTAPALGGALTFIVGISPSWGALGRRFRAFLRISGLTDILDLAALPHEGGFAGGKFGSKKNNPYTN